jgi:hypothetical protein
MTSPYHFYFVFVPRRAYNWRKVRFWKVAVLKQISAMYRKNSWKFSERLFDLWLLVHMPQVITKLSLVLHFSISATEDVQKNWSLPAVLFWQISFTICVCLSISFFLSSFDHGTFERSCYSSLCFNGWCDWVENEVKTGSTILLTLMLLIRIVWSFVWRKFSSVGKENDEMRWSMDKSSSLGFPCHPKKYSRDTSIKAWGRPRHPFFINKNIRSSFKTLYFYCFICYVFFLEHLYFRFQFSFVLVAAINGWTPTCFFDKTHSVFIAKNTLVFTLIVQRVFSFSNTAFSFLFCLDFCSGLVSYL